MAYIFKQKEKKIKLISCLWIKPLESVIYLDFSHEIYFDGIKIELYIHEIYITETLKIFAIYVIFMVNIFSKCKLYWFRRKTLPIIFNVNDIINFQ